MKSSAELKDLLNRIDHKGYPAYKETYGMYQFEGYLLAIDHVQGDPFASPSKVSIHISGTQAGFPAELYDTGSKRIALQDLLLRKFGRQVEDYSFRAKGSGKSGMLSVSKCGPEILERSACQIDAKNGTLTLRMEIGFPANGRTIQARELQKILFDFIPECVKHTLYYRAWKPEELKKAVDLAEDQQFIRAQLRELGLVAFVANGSILPRKSGVSGLPMKDAVPFQSPKTMEISLSLPHYGKLCGMGVRRGITLIVGGGYHGKSTLLSAIELGIYNHIAGDGREYVITDDTAMKIRAEDGRAVNQADISMFINHLPNGKDTKRFYTEDASGSTSQAANVIEAMEAGSRVLLIDEDTSATNFMVRDELMQRVVHRNSEPITPFVERIEELYKTYGMSTILVAGSSGTYFYKADVILQMDAYKPMDITEFAKYEAGKTPVVFEKPLESSEPSYRRCPKSNPAFRDGERIKLKTMGMEGISLNRDVIDLRYLEQLCDTEQLQTLGYLMKYAQTHLFDGRRDMRMVVDLLWDAMMQKGFLEIGESSYLPANLAFVRKQEIFACLNRWRGLRI